MVDADYLIYRIGFAVKDDEPVEYALATVRSSIQNILAKFDQAPWYKLYLSGKDNFRDKLGTIQVYKGNRDPSLRPHYYQEIKDYLIHIQGAIVINGQEADDAVGIEQWANKNRNTVIVSQDKDLNMIPGWHYNPVKEELSYINLSDANEFFFYQMLTGDRTDNIPGIKGIGDVRAKKLLEPCKKAVIDMAAVVKQKYKEQYGDQAEAAYKEVANLLWIRREENQECPF